MMIDINSISYPSYASVAEADAYLAVDPFRGPSWMLYTTDQKGIYLVAATVAMQNLSWCSDIPSTDDPVVALVKNVAILLAAAIGSDPTILSGEAGTDLSLKRAKAGSVEVEYFRGEAIPGSAPPGFPAYLWSMLKTAGMVGCMGDSSIAAPYILAGDCWSHFPSYDHGCSTCAPLAKCQCSGYMPCL